MKTFFKPKGSFLAKDIAKQTNSELFGDANKVFQKFSSLANATADDVSFLTNSKYKADLIKSKAGACFISYDDKDFAPAGMVLFVSKDPRIAYALFCQMCYPNYLHENNPSVSSKAHIEDSATIGKNAHIEPFVYIGKNVKIGNNCTIRSGAIIGDNVEIGNNCIIMPNVVINYAIIGNDCIFNNGASIGSTGFGFAMGVEHIHIPQVGYVLIGNNVSIGANTCIDRAANDVTKIGDNVKIDNLVQIAHNVQIGRGAVIAGCAAIAGSTVIGDYVAIGGNAAIAGHVNIAAQAIIGGHTGVISDIKTPEMFFGTPAEPKNLYLRMHSILKKMARKD